MRLSRAWLVVGVSVSLLLSCGGRGGLDFDDGGNPNSGAPGSDGGSGPAQGGGVVAGGKSGVGGASFGGRTGFSGATSFGGSTLGGATFGGASSGGAMLVRGGSGGRGGGVGGRSGSGGRSSGGGRSGSGGQPTGGAMTSGGTTVGGFVGSGGAPILCPSLAPNEELIDDMNDGNPFIPAINGRSGAWTINHDPTPNVGTYPAMGAPFTMTDSGDPCHGYLTYVKGGPFALWGAIFGFGLGSPYDASKYRGISFWIRSDIGATSGLYVTFPTRFTHPNGGICSASTPGPRQCYDHFGKRIFVSTNWTKVTIFFSELTQDGRGLQAPFEPSSLYEINYQVPTNALFSFHVDDVAFVR